MATYLESASSFMGDLPYRKMPYSGRNWGHPWHSLCSYQGKLKPAIAHFLVSEFTEPGDVVLDPLCGVGTIPFEACLQGRIGIGNDLSEMAYVVSTAKLKRPDKESVELRLNDLARYISDNVMNSDTDSLVEANAQFGFNKKLEDYFHPDTFREILVARQYYSGRLTEIDAADAMVFSSFLHVLHGNRPYALSRTSHPLTPYAPKGDFIYKNVAEHIGNKIELSYKKGAFDTYRPGGTLFGDYGAIPSKIDKVDSIICSPPFAGSIRFYMNNWMRLWLCGWGEDDFKQADSKFLDARQNADFSIYKGFFEMCSTVLKESGKVILHLGKTEKIDMAEELQKYSRPWFNTVFLSSESVENIEKHGVSDKGGTIAHQFLFLEKLV